ncbi:CBM_collapsed_G0016620.mRNA.1.CDS.1 [Saccharomyces cerevisiae]|nr:CBM_collapsed_G0016620.mRNA.1.CDS.1 [Saccharomyces cerevisiae]
MTSTLNSKPSSRKLPIWSKYWKMPPIKRNEMSIYHLGSSYAASRGILWRRIFKLPVKLGLWLLFKFFKGILVTLGLVKSYAGSSSSLQAPSLVLNAPILATTTTSSATSVEPFASVSAVSSIQRAVDEAVDRIVSHDEL